MIANRPFETVANVAASGNSIVNEVFVVWWPYCDCARRVSDCRGQSNGLIMETSVNRRCNLVMGSWCLFGEYSSVCGVCVCVCTLVCVCVIHLLLKFYNSETCIYLKGTPTTNKETHDIVSTVYHVNSLSRNVYQFYVKALTNNCILL